MNKERVLALASAIEENSIKDLEFSMVAYFRQDDCGTIGCIAGWAAHLALGREEAFKERPHGGIPFLAGEWLGLTGRQQDALFEPPGIIYSKVTPEIAVKVLRNFAEIKVIDWRKYIADEEIFVCD